MRNRRLLTALVLSSGYGLAQIPPPSLTTLYNFTGASDGGNPAAPLVIGEGGVLYGTTSGGGTSNAGTVFSLTPPTSSGGSWTETVLYNFQDGDDGGDPKASLVIGSSGVLYGTTSEGGSRNDGTVFSLTPPPSGSGGQWTEAVLYTPPSPSWGGLAIDPAGVLYGATADDPETVFALVPPASPGGAWAASVLSRFDGSSGGCIPEGGVVVGAGGVLYGTTSDCGSTGGGTVFALSPPATPGGGWGYTVLHTFAGLAGGGNPVTGVVIGAHGVLFGTTSQGGTPQGGGTAYLLAPPTAPGVAWDEVVLHVFSPVSEHFANPGPLTLGANGTVYGTTANGGDSFDGTAYVLLPPAAPGDAWTEVLLHTFTGGDGIGPTGLVNGSGGVLYGTTKSGGAYGYGTVFALTE
jgi:uncharacterized repeat protein (TIGR03803 family)